MVVVRVVGAWATVRVTVGTLRVIVVWGWETSTRRVVVVTGALCWEDRVVVTWGWPTSTRRAVVWWVGGIRSKRAVVPEPEAGRSMVVVRVLVLTGAERSTVRVTVDAGAEQPLWTGAPF